jgi:hypothetical protein
MKFSATTTLRMLAFAFVLVGLSAAAAAATINPVNKFSYGANFGWLDWRGDTNTGAVVTDYICSGYIYSANVGWIDVGNGAPANSIQYQNNSATDCGVNLDSAGNLRGFAYGANLGWINFENLGAPKIDLNTGKFSGHCYSANCGWISLGNAFAHVQTDFIRPGPDTDGDGLPDAWELLNFGSLAPGAGDDADGDGATNLQEQLAGTNPNSANSLLAITTFATAPASPISLTWQTVLTRHYFIEQNMALGTSAWFDSGLGLVTPDGATTTRLFSATNAPMRFLRVRAVKPLTP